MSKRLTLPLKIGIGFGLIGLALTVVGIVRGNVPLNPASIVMALVIGGGVWFVVAWAVATAAVDVEEDSAALQSSTASSGAGDRPGTVDGSATLDSV